MAAGATSDDLLGGGYDHQSIALPARPTLSAEAERILAQKLPRIRPPVVETQLPRINNVTVTGQLVLKLPKSAMPWEIRRAFSSIGTLPDGVTVIVKLRARQVVDLADALGGLDDLPAVTIVITGSISEFAKVANAVIALRTSATRRAAQLRQVTS